MAVAVSPSVQLAAVISSAFYSVWFLFTGGLLHVCHHLYVCLPVGALQQCVAVGVLFEWLIQY